MVSFATAVARDFAAGKPQKADATTERILEAGADELMEFGFRRMTIDNVAKRTGVARMTVYRRFRSKEALAAALFIREAVALMRKVNRTVLPSMPFEERWIEGFAVTVKAAREHKLLRRLLVSDPEDTVVALTLRARPVIALASGVMSALIRANREAVSQRDAEWAAESALRLVQSFILTPSRSVKVDEVEELRAYARAQLLPLLPGKKRK